MRLDDYLEHPTLHTALSNVLVDQHHIRPSSLSIANTSLVIQPLPGGPGIWDIAVPFDVVAAVLSLRSAHLSELAGGMSGVLVVATRSSLQASSISLGGEGTMASGSYSAIYSKVATALNLSHKIFASSGADVSLSDAYLVATGPTTRVLRLQWTNYSAGLRTLNVYGEVALYG